MKKLHLLYRRAAACCLALVLMGNLTCTAYGEEISWEDSGVILEKLEESEGIQDISPNDEEQGDIFSDGTDTGDGSSLGEEPGDKTEQIPFDMPGSLGGYPSTGGVPKETVIRKPQILLSYTSLDESCMEVGKAVPFTAVFVNKSRNQGIYNLKITVSTDTGNLNFSPNSFYFTKVSPGQEIRIDTAIKSASDIKEASVPVTFQFEYEDKKGTPAAGTESRSFSVKQPIEMEISAGELPAYLFASDRAELTLGALNLSRTTAYNVRILLEGSGLFPMDEIFIGNMESGTKKEETMELYVGTRTMEEIGVDEGTSDSEKYGTVKGRITLKYEDYQGNPGEITKEFKTEIKKPQILSLNVEEEKEPNSWWISVLAVGILGLMSLVLLLLWKLRRKNVLLEEAVKEGFYEKA